MIKMKTKDYKNKIKAVFFDLDGTLLPLDQDTFSATYLGDLADSVSARGYDREEVIKIIRAGMRIIVNNDGKRTNEEAFWSDFAERNGVERDGFYSALDHFHNNDFSRVKRVCGYTPLAAEAVHLAKSLGLITVLATSPVFPRVATEARMSWAGLSPSDFALFTTYENSTYCKPNPDYYVDLMKRLGLLPEECLMVGNDVLDDMIAETVGMRVFLLTDCLLNRRGADTSHYTQGSFTDLLEYIRLLAE